MKYSFEMALCFLKQGKSICRECELGCYRILDGKVSHEDEHGFRSEAVFLNEDVLAEDWEVLE